jgi:hypothetical protein
MMRCSRSIAKRPLARAKGTRRQGYCMQSLMAKSNGWALARGAIITLIPRLGTPIINSVGQSTRPQPLQGRTGLLTVEPGRKHLHITRINTGDISCILRNAAMPRIRGKPRRGAAWYAAESRRRRKKEFERAMAIVARRRRTRSRLQAKHREDRGHPQVNLPDHPRTINSPDPPSDTQQPSSSLDQQCTRQFLADTLDPSTSQVAQDAPPEPYSPCYVTEEVPPEITTAITEAEPVRPQHGATEDEAAGSGGARDRHRGERTSEVDWAYLNLLHDFSSKLDDQTFRLERMDHRLDMFFAAHSRASTKIQCPTCARPYAFPARWKHAAI